MKICCAVLDNKEKTKVFLSTLFLFTLNKQLMLNIYSNKGVLSRTSQGNKSPNY